MTANLIRVGDAPPAVSLEDAKAFLQVWHDDDDDLITQLVAAATDKLDGADGMLGRCLTVQKWTLTLDAFPAGVMKLPLPPLRKVEAIKYLDPQGVEQTLPEGAHRITGNSVVAKWPQTADEPGAVSVQFEAGYETVPASIAQAVMSLTFYWYENRGAAAAANVAAREVPFGFEDTLTQWRVPVLG